MISREPAPGECLDSRTTGVYWAHLYHSGEYTRSGVLPGLIAASARLIYEQFQASDAPSLAALLADPSLTRNITANGASEESCLAFAHKRINWHNSTWEDRGYGVWALRARGSRLAPRERLLGWCGFVPADGDDPDPEILYAIDGDFRGQGIASEAARHSISWLFDQTDYGGVTAVISTRLNPGSVNVVTKLGFVARGKMDFELFLSNRELADEVVDYEIWRLAQDSTTNLDSLVEQVAYRSGQLSRVTSLPSGRIRQLLVESLSQRFSGDAMARQRQRLQQSLEAEYRKGQDEAYMDCYHVRRGHWMEMMRG